MPKTIKLTDRQYDWFMARNRRVKSMVQTVDQVIALVDRVETDLKKHQAWINASSPKTEQGGLE